MTTATLTPRVISLKELYEQHLTIPDYQRPYKWTEKHVRTLFDDLDYFVAGITAKNRDDDRYKYRLGTIVLHKGSIEAKSDIVDGQQRTLTFLFNLACFESQKSST